MKKYQHVNFELINCKKILKSIIYLYKCRQNVVRTRTINCSGFLSLCHLWASIKWPEKQAIKKLITSVAQLHFSLLLKHQKHGRHLVGWGDKMHSLIDSLLAYFGVSRASHRPAPNCCNNFLSISGRFCMFFCVFFIHKYNRKRMKCYDRMQARD